MRNTELWPNTEFSTRFSVCALARSWPNGFSTTTRRHDLFPSLCRFEVDRPERLSWLTTSMKYLGGTDR